MFCLNLFFKDLKVYKLKSGRNYYLENKIIILNNDILFKKKNILNKKYLDFLFKKNLNNYYVFNKINFFYIKSFLNTIKNFLNNNIKFVFISSDNNNKNLLLTYYTNVFSKNEIYKNKNYLFYNQNHINYTNWMFFFKSFLKDYDIKSIFFLDYVNFSKFFKFYQTIEIIKFSILVDSYLNPYFDYNFFSNKNQKPFISFFILTYFLNTFFFYFNNHNKKKKFLFFLKIKKFLLIKNI